MLLYLGSWSLTSTLIWHETTWVRVSNDVNRLFPDRLRDLVSGSPRSLSFNFKRNEYFIKVVRNLPSVPKGIVADFHEIHQWIRLTINFNWLSNLFNSIRSFFSNTLIMEKFCQLELQIDSFHFTTEKKNRFFFLVITNLTVSHRWI